ncbi:MAG: FkbM family methyltransferase [Anaerolineae bacterium]|nr:FkbM family methyltransferase [Anaerolineae bacterium]
MDKGLAEGGFYRFQVGQATKGGLAHPKPLMESKVPSATRKRFYRLGAGVNLLQKIGTGILDFLSFLPYFKGKGLIALQTLRIFGRSQPLTMRLPNGSRIWVGNDHAGHAVLPYCIGKYEREFTLLFLRFLNRLGPGDSVVDLGANVGYYSVMAAWHLRRFPKSWVFAFEPNPQAFSYLVQNKELNCLSNLVVFQQAIGDQEGRIKLYINPGGITFGSLQPYLAHLTQVCEVSMSTLDKLLQQYPDTRIALIKMDIEGAELFALRGAVEILNTFRPVIFYEENEAACAAFGYNVKDLRNFLRELGYRFEFMKPSDVQNVIAIPGGS